MNPNYGYQLYQAQRTMTRAEVLAGDTRRGAARQRSPAVAADLPGTARTRESWPCTPPQV